MMSDAFCSGSINKELLMYRSHNGGGMMFFVDCFSDSSSNSQSVEFVCEGK